MNFQSKDAVFPIVWSFLVLSFFFPFLTTGTYPVSNMYLLEVPTQWYPYWFFCKKTLLTGEFPLWAPHVFLGTPLHSDPFVGAFYPLFLLATPFSIPRGMTLMFIIHYIAAGAGAYLLARETGASRMGASAAGIFFPLSNYFFFFAQFFPSARVVSYAPLAFFLLIRAWRFRSALPIMGLSVLFFFQITGGDLEMVVWEWLGMFVLVMIKPRRFLVFAIAATIGALAANISALPAIDFTAHSVRSGGITHEFFMGNARPAWTLLLAVIPYFITASGKSVPSLMYMGWFTLCFIAFAVTSPEKRKRNLLLLAAMFFIMLISISMHPIVDIFYYLPLFNVTQLHYNALILLIPVIIVLLAHGFDRVKELINSRNRVIIISLIVIIFGFTKYLLSSKWSEGALLIAAGGFLLVLGNIKRPQYIVWALLMVYAADIAAITLTSFPRREKPPARVWAPLEQISSRPDPMRWLSLSKHKHFDYIIGPQVSYLLPGDKLQSVSGFPRVVLLHTGRLLEILQPNYIRWEDGKLSMHKQNAIAQIAPLPSKRTLLALLGVGYIVSDGVPVSFNECVLKLRSDERSVYELSGAFPRAWFTGVWLNGTDKGAREWIENASVEELATTAFLAMPPPTDAEPSRPGTGEVRLEEYASQRIAISVNAPSSGFVMMSDTYYPGWRAWVDGEETRLFRADIALRAIAVEKGHHNIVMTFRPIPFRIGLWVSIVTLILWITAAMILFRKKNHIPD